MHGGTLVPGRDCRHGRDVVIVFAMRTQTGRQPGSQLPCRAATLQACHEGGEDPPRGQETGAGGNGGGGSGGGGGASLSSCPDQRQAETVHAADQRRLAHVYTPHRLGVWRAGCETDRWLR